MLKLVGQIILGLVILAAGIAYTYYTWTDCLGENGVLTCARMLTK